ncbi:MAG TPA: SDR family oxidoreductase [Pseudomonadota bacterium]|jgi:NAD(P)-dependent dehydrogenase (short-subunit alcohol dehydrogenase family)|nr:SDR family oxidoreductase [Pseudomonadota bacterium]
MSALFSLQNKVAVITGSSRGIGRAIAEQMALAGAKVVISSRKADACEEVAAAIRGAGGEALVIPANISDKAQLQNLVDKTVQTYGRIDILVCNAAINPYFGPSSGISDEQFDKIMHANIKSNHWLCNMVLPQMAARQDGVILIVSSVTGLTASPMLAAYGLSKAADMQLARNLAAEWGTRNIRVNCLAPGLIKTDFARALWENPPLLERITSRSCLRRIGLPNEVAGAAVFLAADAGRFITGQTLVIDGGGNLGDGF